VKTVTVSLVEDEAHIADMLVELLANADGLRFASHHVTAEEALAHLPQINPRVVLVDLQLPGMGGIDCIRLLKRALPDLLCMVLTQFDDGDLLFAALQAGADGYLLKRAAPDEIIEAITTLHQGGGAMSPSICRKVFDYFQKLGLSPAAESALTDREIELLQLARRGKRPKQIAQAMGLSYQTVRTHFRNIYRKLHVQSLRAAVEKTFQQPAETAPTTSRRA